MRSTHRVLTILFLFALLVFVGCASSPAPTTYYLLRGDQVDGTSRVNAVIRAGLGRVVVAPYLVRSKGVMLETGDGEINPASRYQWAEPLDAGLRWYLRTEIGAQLGLEIGGGMTDRRRWDYTVDILVSRLHGTMSGRAVMEASFVVVPTDRTEEISEYRFSKSISLPRDGYAGLVEAEKSLAKELAGLIAEALRERMAPL